METQQSEEIERHFIADESCQSCEDCCSVPFILSFIVVLTNIFAIAIYCAAVPDRKIHVLVSLGISLFIVIVVCGVITYRKVCYSPKLPNNLQRSSDEIYDVPWNINEEEMDYGVINREIQLSLPRCIRETRARETSKQRHSKHPSKSQGLETLDNRPGDNEGSFNYFARRSELVQHQLGNGNIADYSRHSLEEWDGRPQSHECKKKSPNNGLEAARQQYRNGKRTEKRNEKEYWSRRGRSRSYNMQEYEAERDVQTRNVISKNRRSKSETRDYKAERNVPLRENLFQSRRQSKQASPRYKKEEVCSSAEETEMDEHKNIKRRKDAQLRKSDSNIPRRDRDHTRQSNKKTVYNKEIINKQLSQCNRRTLDYQPNRREVVIPKEEIYSSNSKAYKNHPTVSRQHELLPLPLGREKLHITPEYERSVNFSLADARRTGDGMQSIHSKDGKQNNFEFQSEVAARSPRQTMLSRSPNSIQTRFITPKFVIRDGRYSVRSSMPRIPFSLDRTGNLESPQRGTYSSTRNGFSTEYLLKCSEASSFPDRAAIRMTFGTTGNREQNIRLNIFQMRQNPASDCRETEESHVQAPNEHNEINQSLNLENNRHALRNDSREHSRRIHHQNVPRQSEECEPGVDDITNFTESDPKFMPTSPRYDHADSSV